METQSNKAQIQASPSVTEPAQETLQPAPILPCELKPVAPDSISHPTPTGPTGAGKTPTARHTRSGRRIVAPSRFMKNDYIVNNKSSP